MNKMHKYKLARSDRDGLSLRVAQQMQDAVTPAIAQRATERLGQRYRRHLIVIRPRSKPAQVQHH
jgi:hypothetical protein